MCPIRPTPCSGEYYAHKSGEEGPTCGRCGDSVPWSRFSKGSVPEFCEHCTIINEAAVEITCAFTSKLHSYKKVIDILETHFSEYIDSKTIVYQPTTNPGPVPI